MSLNINDLPSGGFVDVSPHKNPAYMRKWNMLTSGWVDNDYPLKYRFGYF